MAKLLMPAACLLILLSKKCSAEESSGLVKGHLALRLSKSLCLAGREKKVVAGKPIKRPGNEAMVGKDCEFVSWKNCDAGGGCKKFSIVPSSKCGGTNTNNTSSGSSSSGKGDNKPNNGGNKTNSNTWSNNNNGNNGKPALKLSPNKPPYTYHCSEGKKCIRKLVESDSEERVGYDVCWLTCGPSGALWPAPKQVQLGKTVVGFNPPDLQVAPVSATNPTVKELLTKAVEIKVREIGQMLANQSQAAASGGSSKGAGGHKVKVSISVSSDVLRVAKVQDEAYKLEISQSGTDVTVTITAETFFGARHALESLSQLMAFDEVNHCLQIVSEAKIDDVPAYLWRGLILDTSRNFFSFKSLYHLLDSMSYDKLNIFHWHISDSNSFPFECKSVPQLTQYGAYGPDRVYFQQEIKKLLEYAKVRGIEIIPEIDSPAHVGNGWEWGKSEGLGDLAVCIGAEPWNSYCGQPPCGQMNPINDNLYDILGKVFSELHETFNASTYHMGGDEVYFKCWNDIPGIQEFKNSHGIKTDNELWAYFHNRAYDILNNATNGRKTKAILWTSGLTGSDEGRRLLSPDKFIIQIWDGDAQHIKQLLEKKFTVIFSNIDPVYLDHGEGSWLGTRHDYPYKNWQKLYNYDLEKIIGDQKYREQVLGGIAALWTEKFDETNVDSKLWPRVSALAERLWTNPKQTATEAWSRFNHHIKYIKALGVRCPLPQPESCLRMIGHCYDPGHDIKEAFKLGPAEPLAVST